MKLRRIALWLILVLGGCVGAPLAALSQSFTPGSAQLPQSDNFDSDATGSIAPGWFAVSGSWQVGTVSPVSNRSFGDTTHLDGDAALYSNMLAQSDMQIYTEQVLPSDAQLVGHILRMDSAYQSGYLVEVSFASGMGQIIIFRLVSGTFVAIGNVSTSVASSAGAVYAERSQIQGSTISVKVWLKSAGEPNAWSGTLVDYSVSAAGYAGLRQTGTEASSVDNFVVSPPTGANPQTLLLSQTGLVDAANQPLASGTVNICPVTQAGLPLAFHIGGGGTGMARCATAQVTNGAWSATVVDTFQAAPHNLCLNISSLDPVSNEELIGWHCVQPSIAAGSPAVANGWCTLNGNCSLDRYSPAIAALPEANLNGGSSPFNGGAVANPIVLPADPTANLQAATKQYVDAHSGGAFNGGAITNPLVLPADPTANLQAATKQYVDAHASAFNGGAVSNPIVLPADPTTGLQAATKQYVDAQKGLGGAGPSGLAITPNGTDPTPQTNSVVVTVPQSVPTPYDLELPTNVTAAASAALPMQCQYFAATTGPPATPPKLVCALTAVSGGALPSQLLAGQVSGSYYGFGYNGTLVAANMIGSFADSTGTDKNYYVNVPTGGQFQTKVNNATAFAVIPGNHPTGACSNVAMALYLGDGYWDYCNGTAYVATPPGGGSVGGLPSQIQAGQVAGNYYGFSFNGSLSASAMNGFFADATAADPSLYFDVPATGNIQFKFANGAAAFGIGPSGMSQPLITPASSSAACTVGQAVWDASFIYICTATNTWKRVALGTF